MLRKAPPHGRAMDLGAVKVLLRAPSVFRRAFPIYGAASLAYRCGAIQHDGVALNYHGASIGIDLDLDDVAAVGEGLSWRYAVMRRIEPRFHARRQFRGIARRLRHRENIEAEIGAGHAEYPIGKTYVLRRDLQKVRSELRAFADDGASRLVKRRARNRKRTRTAAKP